MIDDRLNTSQLPGELIARSLASREGTVPLKSTDPSVVFTFTLVKSTALSLRKLSFTPLLIAASLSLSMRVISVIVWQPSTSEKINNSFAAMIRGTSFIHSLQPYYWGYPYL